MKCAMLKLVTVSYFEANLTMAANFVENYLVLFFSVIFPNVIGNVIDIRVSA